MLTQDKKEIVFICECGKVKSRNSWFFPPTRQLERLKSDNGKMIKLVKAICNTCLKK